MSIFEEKYAKCLECGGDFYSPHNKMAIECPTCKEVKRDDEVDLDNSVRCPSCRHVMCAGDLDIWDEGDNEVCCDDCGHDFLVTTSISYTFSSPEMIKDE